LVMRFLIKGMAVVSHGWHFYAKAPTRVFAGAFCARTQAGTRREPGGSTCLFNKLRVSVAVPDQYSNRPGDLGQRRGSSRVCVHPGLSAAGSVVCLTGSGANS